MQIKYLDLATDIIQRAAAEAVVQDASGVIMRVGAGAPDAPVEVTSRVEQLRPGCWLVRAQVRNVSSRPLALREIAPLSIDAEWGGRLEFGSMPTGWTVFGMSTVVTDGGGVYDLGAWRYDAIKNAFFMADYMAAGDRRNRKYLTAGFLQFGRQHGVFRLQFDEAAYSLDCLRAACEFDRLPLAPGAEIETVPLYVNVADAPAKALDEYTGMVARNQKIAPRRITRVATGWGSWDYYHSHITENDVLENTRWLAAHRAQLPVEYIQLDHGFQTCEGEWLETNEKFPHGLRWLAQEIKQLGFKPALWVCPFLVDRVSRVYREHPDWVILDRDGRPVTVSGYAAKHVYILDCSIPAAREWVRQLGAAIRDYGFEYVKLDGANVQPMSAAGVLADASLTKIQAMRLGLEAFRAGLGDETYLLNACLFGASTGLTDAMRIGGDVGARWDARLIDKHHGERDRYPGSGYIRRCINSAMNYAFLHRRWWANDPDYLMARLAGDRSELSPAETVTWASVVGLTNGLAILGDHLPGLPPAQVEIMSKVLPPYTAGARTVDFFEQEYPALLDLPVANAAESWHVAGVINAHPLARPRDYVIDFAAFGLDAARDYHLFDFWAGNYLGIHCGCFKVTDLPAGHCRVIGIRAVQNIPQLLGTDLHITQGGVEFDAVAYDPQRRAMVCRGVRLRRPGHLFVYLPEKFRAPAADAGGVAAVRRLAVSPDGNGREIVLPI